MKKLKIIIWMMAVAIVGVVIWGLTPSTAYAADAIELKDTIENYDSNFTAVVDAEHSTVTVTGTANDASSTLNLDIDEGVTVLWQASITASASYSDALISISGEGTFEVAEDGVVSTDTGTAIKLNENSKVTVSGGTVGTTFGYAIYNDGNDTGTTAITVNGGTVSAIAGYAIYDGTTTCTITVSGGTISAEDDTAEDDDTVEIYGTAIFTGSTVNIQDGTVSSTKGYAVKLSQQYSSITVSGGTVNTSGYKGVGILADAEDCQINITGGTVSASSGYGIAIKSTKASNTVTVSSGLVSVTNGYGIYGTAEVLIQGGTVSSSEMLGKAIYFDASDARITVSAGVITSTKGHCIYAKYANAKVTVTGGELSSENTAIYSSGDEVDIQGGTLTAGYYALQSSATGAEVNISGGTLTTSTTDNSSSKTISAKGNVNISGGEVIATAGRAVYINNLFGSLTVSGTAKVSSTGSALYTIFSFGTTDIQGGEVSATTGTAIYAAMGNVNISGGEVSATTGYAVHAFGASSEIIVNGGRVFAYGSTVTGEDNVIYLPYNTEGFSGASGTGMVIAWNNGTGRTTYAAQSSDDINLLPSSGAEAYWSNNDEGTGGIAYKNSTNEGFIPLSVTVPTTVPADTATNGSFTDTDDTDTGEIGGTITWTAVELTDNMIGYHIYWGSDKTTKLEGKTDAVYTLTDSSSVSQTVNSDTSLPDGANYFLIYSYNAYGDSTGCLAVAIMDIPSYTIEEISDQTFTELTAGYISGEQETKEITIARTGTEDLTNVSVALSGTNADSFTITQPTASTLDDMTTSTTCTVKAKDGLTAGTYTATVTVSADNMTDETFTITQTVKASSDAALISVLSQTNNTPGQQTGTSTSSAITWEVTVANSVSELTVSDISAAGETVNLYTDADFSSEVRSSSAISLAEGGETNAYIKITAQDNTTVKYYDVEITREASSNDDDNGGNGSNGNNRDNSSDTNKIEKQEDGSAVITTLTPKVNKETGKAKISITADEYEKAVKKTETDDEGIKKVEIQIPSTENAKEYEVELPRDALEENEGNVIGIETAIGKVTLPGNMLKNEGDKETGNISLSLGNVNKEELDSYSNIDEATKEKIGDRPVIDISLSENGKVKAWKNEDEPVNISIPYMIKEGEDSEHIVVWYIDGEGNAVSVPNGRYNPDTGMVEFDVTHFSTYAVAYIEKTFNDLSSYSWAKNAIEILASKGIINGTSDNTFSPNTNITRADFLTLLVKTLELTAEFDNNFDDVKVRDYYYESVGIAKELGITGGVGENLFNPTEKITRQDMMVLTARALKEFKGFSMSEDMSVLNQFNDKENISAYAAESLTALVKEGLITGDGNTIKPSENTTRAEAAVFLYRIYNRF